MLRARFSDAQCGFKAARADVARQLLPQVRDEGWFFDTELLILAQRRGLRVFEVPVDWVDDPDSRVDVVSTAVDDLKGVARLALEVPLVRFLIIGVVSTIAYVALFLLLRSLFGAGGANALALALTAIANTQANRHFTFGLRGRRDLFRQHAAGALVYLLALGLTLGALDALRALNPQPARWLEVAVLVVAGALATVTRYLALRTWVFAARVTSGLLPPDGPRGRRTRPARRRHPAPRPVRGAAFRRAPARGPALPQHRAPRHRT